MEVGGCARESSYCTADVFSLLSGVFFQLKIREAKLRGHRPGQEFMVLLTNFSTSEMLGSVRLHFWDVLIPSSCHDSCPVNAFTVAG